jgi:endonuclease YncB( thermonuclease family)
MKALLWAFALACLMIWGAAADPISPDRIRVLDGDTIRIDGQKPDHRLVGFNAPETRRAKTEHERNLGSIATFRLREIVRGGNLDYSKVECSCKPDTAGTQWCNYGRFCGTLKSNGVDVGQILIGEELAVPFICGPTVCPKTPNPWR